MNKEKYLSKFRPSKRTEEQLAGDIIYAGFSKKLPYPQIMGLIKIKGKHACMEEYLKVSKAECDDPIKLFLWRMSKNIVTLQEK